MTKITITTPFTIEELKDKLSDWESKYINNGDLFLSVWYEDGKLPSELENDEDTPEEYRVREIPGLGMPEVAECEGGEGDGAEISVVIKIAGRYFRKTGYYSSWGDSELDGALEEVYPRQVVRTEYYTAKEKT